MNATVFIPVYNSGGYSPEAVTVLTPFCSIIFLVIAGFLASEVWDCFKRKWWGLALAYGGLLAALVSIPVMIIIEALK